MNFNFYNFAKKENSTATPTGDGTTITAVWKTPSSIEAPVIEITSSSMPAYNYCYCASTGRYYYVVNTVFNAGVWELSLRVDVLASFKTDIGSTTMYIVRSSAAKNSYIRDDLYPVTCQVTRKYQMIKNITSFSNGCFVVNVINSNNNTGTTAYVFNNTSFGLFLDQIGVNSQTSIWDSMTQSIQVSIYDPIRYIASVYWFPSSYSDLGAGTWLSTLQLGNFTASVSCQEVSMAATALTKSYSVTIPKHDSQSTLGYWLNVEPYAEYYANLGPFGSIKLDSAAMATASSLTINVLQDPFTGQGRAMITTNAGTLIANVATQWGVPVKVSSNTTFNLSNLAGIFGGAASAVFEGRVKGIGETIGSIADVAKGSLTTVGSMGAFADYAVEWDLDCKFYSPASGDNANNGRPYCNTSTPATLTGYMKAMKGLVTSTTANKTELDSINAYMEEGFYYE